MEQKFFRGTEPVVFSTNPENPEEGRTFVWGWTEWFERIEGPAGNIAFSPVAASQEELRDWLYQQDEPEPTEVAGEYGGIVRREFLDQAPLYPEMPEVSSEEPYEEQSPGGDIEHG